MNGTFVVYLGAPGARQHIVSDLWSKSDPANVTRAFEAAILSRSFGRNLLADLQLGGAMQFLFEVKSSEENWCDFAADFAQHATNLNLAPLIGKWGSPPFDAIGRSRNVYKVYHELRSVLPEEHLPTTSTQLRTTYHYPQNRWREVWQGARGERLSRQVSANDIVVAAAKLGIEKENPRPGTMRPAAPPLTPCTSLRQAVQLIEGGEDGQTARALAYLRGPGQLSLWLAIDLLEKHTQTGAISPHETAPGKEAPSSEAPQPCPVTLTVESSISLLPDLPQTKIVIEPSIPKAAKKPLSTFIPFPHSPGENAAKIADAIRTYKELQRAQDCG